MCVGKNHQKQYAVFVKKYLTNGSPSANIRKLPASGALKRLSDNEAYKRI